MNRGINLATLAAVFILIAPATSAAQAVYAFGEGGWTYRLDAGEEILEESLDGTRLAFGAGFRLRPAEHLHIGLEMSWEQGRENDDPFTPDIYRGILGGASFYYGSFAQVGGYARIGFGKYEVQELSDVYGTYGALLVTTGAGLRIQPIEYLAFTARVGFTGPFAQWFEAGGGLELILPL